MGRVVGHARAVLAHAGASGREKRARIAFPDGTPDASRAGMNMEKWTVKAQEALGAAQTMAREASHQQLDAEHLLLALVQQADGVVPQLIQKVGAKIGRAHV